MKKSKNKIYNKKHQIIQVILYIKDNNLKHKTKLYQPKVEFYLTQKFINLKNWCNKKKIKQKMKKKLRERERERERGNIFCVRKLCIEWKRKCQIYSKILKIRRVKIKEDKKVEKEWY